MSSSRITQALAAGKLVVVNAENVSVSLFIQINPSDGSKPSRKTITLRPKQKLDITKFCSVDDIRKNSKLQNTIITHRIQVLDTWTREILVEVPSSDGDDVVSNDATGG